MSEGEKAAAEAKTAALRNETNEGNDTGTAEIKATAADEDSAVARENTEAASTAEDDTALWGLKLEFVILIFVGGYICLLIIFTFCNNFCRKRNEVKKFAQDIDNHGSELGNGNTFYDVDYDN